MEEQLLRKKHKAVSCQPSILHFSLNKSATQFVRDILVIIAKKNNLTHAGLNEYAFNSNLPFLDQLSFEEMKLFKHVFKPQGYLYSVFGGFVKNIDCFNEFRVLLMVRDPRDILVSMYYSMVFSHSVPIEGSNKRKEFLRNRERAQSITIDEFVLERAPKLAQQLYEYRHLHAGNFENVLVTSYEMMLVDFIKWLEEVITHLGLTLDESTKDYIIQKNFQLQPKGERPTEHLRNGKPGDYLIKLKNDTIHKLNDIFCDDLKIMGYH